MQISSNKQDFWKKLESMESTSYVGESLDGLVAVAILRLHEESIETTMENIVVTAYKLFPDKFSMISFPEYPDYMRVFTSVRMHLKQFVEGNMKRNYFILNGKGRIFAQNTLERILKGGKKVSGKKSEFKRKKETKLVLGVTKSDGFQKFKKNDLDEIKKFDICESLHCTIDASDEHLQSNLAMLEGYTKLIDSNLSYKETAKSVLEYLDFIKQNWERIVR